MSNLGSPDGLEELLFCQDILGRIPSGKYSFHFHKNGEIEFLEVILCLTATTLQSIYFRTIVQISHKICNRSVAKRADEWSINLKW